jgi:hypothetical protein
MWRRHERNFKLRWLAKIYDLDLYFGTIIILVEKKGYMIYIKQYRKSCINDISIWRIFFLQTDILGINVVIRDSLLARQNVFKIVNII